MNFIGWPKIFLRPAAILGVLVFSASCGNLDDLARTKLEATTACDEDPSLPECATKSRRLIKITSNPFTVVLKSIKRETKIAATTGELDGFSIIIPKDSFVPPMTVTIAQTSLSTSLVDRVKDFLRLESLGLSSTSKRVIKVTGTRPLSSPAKITFSKQMTSDLTPSELSRMQIFVSDGGVKSAVDATQIKTVSKKDNAKFEVSSDTWGQYEIVTDQTPPVPGNSGSLVASNISATGFTVSWTAATDDQTSPSLLQYEVRSSTSDNIASLANAESNGTLVSAYSTNKSSFTFSSLSASVTYYFTVIVKDEAGNKALYASSSINTADTIAPTVASSGLITSSVVTSYGFTLSWGAASDNITAVSNLAYFVCSGVSAAAIDTVSECEAATQEAAWTNNTLQHVTTGKAPGVTFYSNVIVRDSAGNMSLYAGATVTTSSDATVPTAGTFSSSTGVGNTGFTLNWSAASDNVTAASSLGYFVCSGGSAAAIDTVSECEAATQEMAYTTNTLTLAISGKSPSTTYYYNAVVRDAAGNKSIYDGRTQATTADVTVPTAGTFSASTSVGATGFTLNWSAATDNVTAASSLEYFVCSAGSAAAINSVAGCEAATSEMAYTANTTTLAISGKSPTTTYYYNVVVRDAANNKSIYNGITQATVADTTAPTPGSSGTITVPAPSITATGFTLEWVAAADNATAAASLQYFVCSGASIAAIDTVSECESATSEMAYTANTLSLVISGKSPVTTYYYNVVVRDAANNKAFYAARSQETASDTTAPTAGTFSASTSVGATAFTLNWSAATDNITAAASLQYFVCSGGSAAAINSVAGCEAATSEMAYTANTLTRAITGKSPTTTYYYNVVVRDVAGNKSIYDGKTQATAADTTAPTAGTFSVSGSVTSTSFTLNWSAASDNVTAAASLQYFVCSGGSAVAINSVAGCEAATSEMAYAANTTTLAISGKSPTTTYYYNVVVRDAAGNKSIYDGKTQATAADTTAPTAGTFSVSGSVTSTSFTLNWSAATDNVTAASSLQYFVCSGASAAAIDTVSECETAAQEMAYTANALTLAISGKSAVTTYYYNVIVRDDAGNKALYDGRTQATTADVTVPTAGTFSAATGVGNTGFTLNWSTATDNVTAASSLQYFVCSGGSAAAIDTVSECEAATQEMSYTANTLTLAISGKSPATTYYYNVVVRDAAGNKAIYNGRTQTTTADVTAPTPGSSGAITVPSPSITATGFTLQWAAATDNITAGASLEYFVCSGANTAAIDTAGECIGATQEMAWTANTTQLVISGKSPVTTYYYNVLVRDAYDNRALYTAKDATTASDTTAPTAGSFSTTTSVGFNGFTLNWSAGSDTVTAASSLQYFVCSGADADAINTVSECDAATQVMAYTANTLTYTVTGRSPSTTYYYNVIVRDAAGNKSIYNGRSQATSSNAAPTISVSEPNGTGDSIAAGTSFNIALSGADSDDAATISLYYNYGSSGCSTGLAGWTQIVSGLAENTTTYSWNTTGLGIGTRYICAVITDGVNAAVHSVSPGPITFTGDLVLGANAYINSSGRLISDSGSTVLLGASSGDGSPSTPFVFNISGNLDMGNYTIRGAYDSSTSQHAATWIVTGNISGTGSFDSFTTGNHQWGGNVRLEAGGSIAIKRVISSMVFRTVTAVGGGDVYIWAKNGAVTITEAIDTRGGGGYQDGGDVTIRSEGSGAAISIQSAYAGEDGLNHSILAEAYGWFMGRNGGTIALYTQGAITLAGGISTRTGRWTYDGGNGGSITIRGDLSDSNLRAGAVSIGGTGGILSKSDKAGSAGGTVTVRANSLAVTANVVTSSYAYWGQLPGNVDINVLTTCTIGGYIDARLREFLYTVNYPGSVSITGRNIAINGVDVDGFSIRTWPENGFRYSQDLTPTNAGNITLTGIDTSTAHYEFPSRTSGATSSVVVAGKIESGRFFHDGSMGNIAISAVEVQLGGDVTINTPSAASTLTINYGVTTYGMHRHLVENNTRWNGTSGHAITYSVSGGTLAFNANVAYAGIRIPGLYSTGVNDQRQALGNNDTETHWDVYDGTTLIGDAAIWYDTGWGGTGIPGAYLPNITSGVDQARWIWQASNGYPAGVTRKFRTSFDLSGLNPDTAVVHLTTASDATYVSYYLNGVTTNRWQPKSMGADNVDIRLESGFVSGTNTLDLLVEGDGGVDGFLLKIFSATAKPLANGAGTLLSTVMRGTAVPGSWTVDYGTAHSVTGYDIHSGWPARGNWIFANNWNVATFVYRQTFTLTQTGTASGDLITWTTNPSFSYAGDDDVSIYVDNALGNNLVTSRTGAYGSLASADLSSYLVAGSNTIRIEVYNAGQRNGLYVGDILGRFVP